jgi:hypothetical protein
VPGPAPHLELLVSALSRARYEPFLVATGKDLDRAWNLYQWNSAVSSAILESIGTVEVPLRNSLHRQLCDLSQRRHGSPDWFNMLAYELTDGSVADVEKAKDRITRRLAAVTPGRIVAELNLGFWRYLLGERYARSLWNPGGLSGLRGAFGPISDRRTIDLAVTRMYELRNRVAHHEPVIKFTEAELVAEIHGMDRLLGWMNPGYPQLHTTNRVLELISLRP